MHEPSFLSTPVFQYVVMPLLIFIARICDVSISTVRLMLQEILRSGTLERAKIIAAGALATGDFKPLLTLGQLERNVTALRTVGRRPARGA